MLEAPNNRDFHQISYSCSCDFTKVKKMFTLLYTSFLRKFTDVEPIWCIFCSFTYTNHNVLFRNQSRISNPSVLPHQEDISIQRRKKPQNGPFKKGSSTLLSCCERLPIYDEKMNLVFSLACSLHYFQQSVKCVKLYRLIAPHDYFIAMWKKCSFLGNLAPKCHFIE